MLGFLCPGFPRVCGRAGSTSSEVTDRDGNAPTVNVELLAALVNKALNVAELILKDEKYRRVVASTPNLINKVLALLEQLDSTETKKLALRVISTLGDSTDNKLEIGACRAVPALQGMRDSLRTVVAHALAIRPPRFSAGRHEGFRKILRLLVEGDAELTQEIIRTIRHLLDVPQVRLAFPGQHGPTRSLLNAQRAVDRPRQIATLASAAGMAAAGAAGTAGASGDAVGHGRPIPASFLTSTCASALTASGQDPHRAGQCRWFGLDLVGDKLSSLLADMGSFVVTGMSRYFKPTRDGALRVRLNENGDVAGALA